VWIGLVYPAKCGQQLAKFNPIAVVAVGLPPGEFLLIGFGQLELLLPNFVYGSSDELKLPFVEVVDESVHRLPRDHPTYDIAAHRWTPGGAPWRLEESVDGGFEATRAAGKHPSMRTAIRQLAERDDGYERHRFRVRSWHR